jgi:hypothetical protein
MRRLACPHNANPMHNDTQTTHCGTCEQLSAAAAAADAQCNPCSPVLCVQRSRWVCCMQHPAKEQAGTTPMFKKQTRHVTQCISAASSCTTAHCWWLLYTCCLPACPHTTTVKQKQTLIPAARHCTPGCARLLVCKAMHACSCTVCQ